MSDDFPATQTAFSRAWGWKNDDYYPQRLCFFRSGWARAKKRGDEINWKPGAKPSRGATSSRMDDEKCCLSLLGWWRRRWLASNPSEGGGEGGLEIHPHPPLEREDEVHGFFFDFQWATFFGRLPPCEKKSGSNDADKFGNLFRLRASQNQLRICGALGVLREQT